MIDILRMGENSLHDKSFEVNRLHGHPVYLLLLVKTPAKFYFNDSWNDTPKHIALIFKPEQMHRYKASEKIYINSWAHIHSTQPLLGEHFPFGIPVALHNFKDYSDLFHIICNEFYGTAPNKDIVIHNLTIAMIHKIADESNMREFPNLYYQLATIRKQIYNHPDNRWTIQNIAEKLSISTGYLHSSYQHFFNTTCMTDVINSRIQSASELLLSTNKAIHEIAELCGYNNTEHFIRQYKAQTGITPGRYRKMIVK